MIDPKYAQQMIDNYQKGEGPGSTKAEFFGFRKLSQLLAQKNAIGLRIYYCKDDKGVDRMVVVAATPDEKNIGPIDGTTTDGLVLENGTKCPPYCNVTD